MTWEQCENSFRPGGGRWARARCSRRANTTVRRVNGETRHVCGVCARRLTTGRDRTPVNPWTRQEES